MSEYNFENWLILFNVQQVKEDNQEIASMERKYVLVSWYLLSYSIYMSHDSLWWTTHVR